MSLDAPARIFETLNLSPTEWTLLLIVVPLTIGVVLGYGRGAALGFAALVIGLAVAS